MSREGPMRNRVWLKHQVQGRGNGRFRGRLVNKGEIH